MSADTVDLLADAVGLPRKVIRGDPSIVPDQGTVELWGRVQADLHASLIEATGDRSLLELRHSIEDAQDDVERELVTLWTLVYHSDHFAEIESFAATRPVRPFARLTWEDGEIERILALGRLTEDADPIEGEIYLARWLAQRWTADEIAKRFRAAHVPSGFCDDSIARAMAITREVLDEVAAVPIQLSGSIKSVQITMTIETP